MRGASPLRPPGYPHSTPLSHALPPLVPVANRGTHRRISTTTPAPTPTRNHHMPPPTPHHITLHLDPPSLHLLRRTISTHPSALNALTSPHPDTPRLLSLLSLIDTLIDTLSPPPPQEPPAHEHPTPHPPP